jgi:predicted nicotinamide N-methyase
MYLNSPSGLAASARAVVALAGAGVVAVAELVVGAADVVGVEADELVLVEELPHPASASRPRANATIDSVGRERFFGQPARCDLTVSPP